jgi:hypothetical protein
MDLFITESGVPSHEDWQFIWDKCAHSTYFHSPRWADIWQTYSKGRIWPAATLIQFSDGKRAIITMSKRRLVKGIFHISFSSAASTYGGWISDCDLDENHVEILTHYLTKKCGPLIWRISPIDELMISKAPANSIYDDTHILDLEPGFEILFKSWTKGHRSAVKKAVREGVNIRQAETLKEWEQYYMIYRSSIERWGKSATSFYDWTLFTAMRNSDHDNIKLWIAAYEDRVIGGALCLYSPTHVSYWHGASDETYFNLRPANLLMYESIRDACEKSYRWFDFNPSGGHPGVRSFKKSFGTSELPCPIVTMNSRLLIQANRLIKKMRALTIHTR